MMIGRAFILAAVGFAAPALVACGGVKVPQHSGYKGKHPKPWEKAKEIKLGSDFKGKGTAELDYGAYKRARWFWVQLPGPGDLAIDMEVVPGSGGPTATDEEGEPLDMDVAIELLDPEFRVIAKRDLESEDAHSLKKTLTHKQLDAGRYLLHVYVHGRLDSAEVELKLAFVRGEATWKSDFPKNVEFVPALAAVSPTDDTPQKPKKPTRSGGGGAGAPRPKPPEESKEPTAPKGGLRVADITDTQPDASGGVRIVIRAGTNDGMADGLKGSIDGVPGSSFTLTGCTATTCRAVTRATMDAVRSSGRGSVTIRLK